MIIYEPLGIPGYEFCHPVRQDDFIAIAQLINGTARTESWRPFEVQILDEENGEKLRRSDCPWLGSDSLIFRESAVKGMSKLLRDYGEILPLSCRNASVFIYNPTRVLDALDEVHSVLLRTSKGELMHIRKYAFYPEIVQDANIFKIRSLKVSPTFVGQEFVDQWEAAGLVGLQFRQVWSSD